MQDNTRFDGRVAIVTGAGSRPSGTDATTIGNGRAIAALLARRGARVLLLDVERDWLKGRVYVPYGNEWYGYLMRRLAERPSNLTFFLHSLVSRK